MAYKPVTQSANPLSNKTEGLKTRTSKLISQALKSQAALPQSANQSLQALQQVPQVTPIEAQLDALCARRMHFWMPEEPVAAVEQMELAVLSLTHAEQCELFAFDETTGIYTSLSDEKQLGAQPRELTTISDGYLNQWLEISSRPNTRMAHTHLMLNNELVGMVAIRCQTQGIYEPQLVLEILAPYLALKVAQFRQIKQGLIMPHKQEVLAELSNRLVSAVDKESIITETLDVLWSRLGFGACQYVVLSDAVSEQFPYPPNAQDVSSQRKQRLGEGVVLYENNNGRLKSFFHAGLMSKRHVVKDFGNIVNLLSSGWRKHNYLHLSGGQLGERSLSSVFGVKQVHSALILPIIDVQTGKIQATLNVFQTKPIDISPETIDLLLTLMDLVSNALGRAVVLEKALALATRDELTGLLNRRGFYERFHSEMDRLRRHPSHLCVALIDVDYFKKLNDTYGHLSGDEVLKALGTALMANVRRTDIVSRFGGEEFAILLPDTTPEGAVELLERVRRNISQMTVVGANNEELQITVSIGVSAVLPVDGQFDATEIATQKSISQALAQADVALYDAKTQGRNRVCQ